MVLASRCYVRKDFVRDRVGGKAAARKAALAVNAARYA
jgi:hypothetical protein